MGGEMKSTLSSLNIYCLTNDCYTTLIIIPIVYESSIILCFDFPTLYYLLF